MTLSLIAVHRRSRILTIGTAATVSLYALVIFVAEPLKTFGQTTANTVVQFSVTSALSVSCSGTSTLGSAAGNGTAGTGALATAFCQPITNNSLGYTLSWIILSGSGVSPSVNAGCNSVTTCFGTGHLLSNNVTAGLPDVIRSMRIRSTGGDTFWETRGRRFDQTTTLSGSGSRWGARLRAISTTPAGGAVTWGTDGATEGFLAVATGSSVNIAKRTTETSAAGDLQHLLFKVVIPSGAFQPTGTYRATVRFTVVDN